MSDPATSTPANDPASTGHTDATDLPETPRTRFHRKEGRRVTDRATLYRILDSEALAHVGFIRDGSPVVIPFAYGRDGDTLILHGSTGAGTFLDARDGIDVCVSIAHLTSLVFARSTYDSSMDYESVVAFGRATPVPDERKTAALAAFTEHVMPGRWAEVRELTAKELAATAILELPLDEVSVKVRDVGFDDSVDDGESRAVWAGVLPFVRAAGTPTPAGSVPANVPIPESVTRAAARFRK